MSEQPKNKSEDAYFIEIDKNGCPSCGHGKLWNVIGPDGMALSTLYEDEEDAQRLADLLNEAFWHGRTEPLRVR